MPFSAVPLRLMGLLILLGALLLLGKQAEGSPRQAMQRRSTDVDRGFSWHSRNGRGLLEGPLPGKDAQGIKDLFLQEEEPLGNLTASLRVRLDSLPEGDLLPNEGINVTVWAQDSWSNALPQLVASKAIMYSPEIVDEGISVELPLENLLPGSTEGEQADRLVYFVELRGLQDCCRFTYTLDRLGLNLLDPEPLVVQPRLDPAVCNATVVCGVGGSHAVQIHLTLDSLPPEGFFPSDGVTVSLWAYDSAAWHPEGQQLLPMLLGAVEVRGGGEDHSGHVPLSYDLSIVYDLPYALASLTPTGRVAVYAAVNSLNEQQYRYFGFQPIEGLSNHTELHASLLPPPLPRQPSWTATDAQEFPEPKLLTLDSVPLAEPSEDLVALRVRVDEAPEGGFREGEGLSVRLWTLPDNNVAGSTAVLAAEVVAANPGAMLSKQGQPIEVEAAGGLKGFGRYYVTVGPLGGCCRYDYAVQGFTEVAVPGPRVLVFAKRVKGTCSNEPCRIDGPETPGAVAAVVVGLHVDSPPSMPGFGDNEGVLVSLLAAETHEDPKQHSRAAVAAAQQRGHGTRPASLDAMPDIVHSRRLFKIAEAFVSGAVGLGGLPTNVTLPVVLEAMPVGLRGAVAEGRARIWAEISSPGCCRYEYRSHPGVPALLDTTRQPPYALVKATLQQGEPCNATRACTL